MIHKQEIKEFLNSPAGKECLRELAILIKELDTVRNLDEKMSARDIGIDQITNRKAISIIETWLGGIDPSVQLPEIKKTPEDDVILRLEKAAKE